MCVNRISFPMVVYIARSIFEICGVCKDWIFFQKCSVYVKVGYFGKTLGMCKSGVFF